MPNKVSTEGEELIEMYLEYQGIKYKREVEISRLAGDNSSYRVADFYLPKYKVYVEFLGQWNTSSGKERYHKKQEVYRSNRIPCVYIYPDNLGTLEYIFRKRLKEELKRHPELSFQLFRLKLKRFMQVNTALWLALYLFVLLALISENIMSGQLRITSITVIAFCLSLLFAVIIASVGIYKMFIKK